MESAVDMAASAEKKAATGAEIGAGFDFAAAIGTLLTGGADLSQLGQFAGMTKGEGGGFLGGFGGAG